MLAILAAVVPDAPVPAVTSSSDLNTRVTWVEPGNNGSPIESYDIVIKGLSGSFYESTTCTGSDPSLTECLVAYTELRTGDFSLSLGALIEVQVRAINEIGPGSYSNVNESGDIIRTEPLSPPNALTEGPSTDDSQIELQWTALEEPYTGYDTILAYDIYWDNGSNGQDWILIESQVIGAFTFNYVQTSGI